MGDHYCIICTDFASSSVSDMKRHVAIIHGKGTFSTLRCQICQQKFYDFEQVQEHVREKPACFAGCFKVTQEQLEPHVENAFLSLVSQMMQPIKTQPTDLPESSGQKSTTKLNCSETAAYQHGLTPTIVSVCSLARSIRSIKRTRVNSGREVDGQTSQNSKDIKQFNIDSEANGNVLTLAASSRASGDSSGKAVSQWATSNMGSPMDHMAAMIIETDKTFGKETSPKRTYDELLRDCKNIIDKRQYNGRITCALCQSSVKATVYDKYISKTQPLAHVQRHLGVCASQCNLCEYKSMRQIQRHIPLHLPMASPDQITDTTMDHIEELKKLFSRCFDHNIRVDAGLKRGHRISEPDHGEGERNTGKSIESIGVSCTIHGYDACKKSGTQIPLRFPQKTGKHESSTVTESIHNKIAHASFLAQKRAQLEKLKTFVRNGRLQCQLCSRSITVGEIASKPITVISMNSAYRHAFSHLSMKLLKCSKCSFVASGDTSLFKHNRLCQAGTSRTFIDYSSKYSQEIFKNLLACYKVDQDQNTTSELNNDQKLEETKDAAKPADIDATTTKRFACDKCSYTSGVELYYKMHKEIMH